MLLMLLLVLLVLLLYRSQLFHLLLLFHQRSFELLLCRMLRFVSDDIKARTPQLHLFTIMEFHCVPRDGM